MLNYEFALECRESGNISEEHWEMMLQDEVFCAWLKKKGVMKVTAAAGDFSQRQPGSDQTAPRD